MYRVAFSKFAGNHAESGKTLEYCITCFSKVPSFAVCAGQAVVQNSRGFAFRERRAGMLDEVISSYQGS